MKRIVVLSFLILCLDIMSFSQERIPVRRQPYALHLAVNGKTFYEENLSEGDYVHPGNIVQLYPGETLYLEAKDSNGIIGPLVAVDHVKDSSKTIIVSLRQHTKGKIHSMMMLSVHNPFEYTLSYKAVAFFMSPKKWIPTSIMPVMPKLDGFETWPEIIISMALQNWTLDTK